MIFSLEPNLSRWVRPLFTAAGIFFLLSYGAAYGQSSATNNAATLEARPQPNATLEQVQTLLQKGKLGEAETDVRQYLKDHADSADAHFLLGYILFEEIHQKYVGQEDKQGEGFRYNDNVGPSLAELRDARARESLAEFTAGAKTKKPNAFDLKIVALDYVLLKDYISADKWLSLSLSWQPKDAQSWYYLGRTKYSESQFPQAIEAFEQCLKLEPKNVLAEYNVGLSYQGLGLTDQAIQAYRTDIAWQAQSNVKTPEPFLFLASLYLDENKPEKAMPYLLQAAAAFPQVSEGHEELARAYSDLHQLANAQKELETAVQLSPEKAPLRCMLGQVYREEKMIAQAQTQFDRCSALQKAQAMAPAPMR